MTVRKEEKKLRFIINIAYFAVIAVIAYLILKYALGWVMPFALGFIFAALTQPAARRLNKRTGINIQVCGVVSVIFIFAVFAFICFICASRILEGLSNFTAVLPGLAAQFTAGLTTLSERLSVILKKMPHLAGVNIDTSLGNISMQILKLTSLADGTGKFIQSVVTSMPGMLLNIVVTVIAACFISADYPKVTGFLIRQLPERYRKTAVGLKSFFLNTVAKLIRAYLTLMFITFCELSAGLLLIRIPHAVAVAALIAVVDILPVLGTGTVMIPWVVIELIMGDFYKALGLALVYAIITVVRNILEPKIVGSHLGLHPLVTLAAIIIGLKSMGFAGMILFPIIIILLKHLRESGIIKLWND